MEGFIAIGVYANHMIVFRVTTGSFRRELIGHARADGGHRFAQSCHQDDWGLGSINDEAIVIRDFSEERGVGNPIPAQAWGDVTGPSAYLLERTISAGASSSRVGGWPLGYSKLDWKTKFWPKALVPMVRRAT